MLSINIKLVTGYVYYEVDCFDDIRNPYIPLDSEQSLAHVGILYNQYR